MKYYTIEQAVKIAEKEKKAFSRDINLKPSYGIYNCVRCLFGYKPKMYYMVGDKK